MPLTELSIEVPAILSLVHFACVRVLYANAIWLCSLCHAVFRHAALLCLYLSYLRNVAVN